MSLRIVVVMYLSSVEPSPIFRPRGLKGLDKVQRTGQSGQVKESHLSLSLIDLGKGSAGISGFMVLASSSLS